MYDDFTKKVVKDWDSMKSCYFADKRWVNRKNVSEAKEYEEGDFLRVYCTHNQIWCSNETNDPNDCAIFFDHNNE